MVELAGVLEPARGLTPRGLRALTELEARTIEADGGRLKLEWGALRTRAGRDVEDLLWWEGDRLLGFLGLYAFGSSTVEIAGMVDPAARRRGIATGLLDAALAICRDRGHRQVLLVTPRGSAGGRQLALRRGAVLEHSEHALVLGDAPTEGLTDPRIRLRAATPADVGAVAALLSAAFGWPSCDAPRWRASDAERTLLAEVAGCAVATVRVTRDRGQRRRVRVRG